VRHCKNCVSSILILYLFYLLTSSTSQTAHSGGVDPTEDEHITVQFLYHNKESHPVGIRFPNGEVHHMEKVHIFTGRGYVPETVIHYNAM